MKISADENAANGVFVAMYIIHNVKIPIYSGVSRIIVKL